jgi:hypothetical protein
VEKAVREENSEQENLLKKLLRVDQQELVFK